MDTQLLNRLGASLKAQSDKPEETPESTLKALYFAAAGKPLSVARAVASPLPELDGAAKNRLQSLVEQRCAGIPLAHLTGRQQFMGIEMLAGSEALVPRVETEILGYEALSIARSLYRDRGPLTIMDICTGSGNVILGLMAHEKKHAGYGSDLSSRAIELARKNSRHLGLDDRVNFRHGDLFAPFQSAEFMNRADLITCNPPYISSHKVSSTQSETFRHEPHLAFDGGPYGVSVLSRVIKEAPWYLKPDSYLCFEVGVGQGRFVERLFGKSEHRWQYRSLLDNHGNVRAFVART